MKLEDVKDLQALVAEHADSVEAGLRVLEARVLLGGATIDLLALDSSESLVLLALGFAADDELLMRALEAYSWCLEYPDALRRLYPSVRLSETQPPRVIFVAERLPEAFLRKARHLRLHRVDFVEFKFGLQFTTVDSARRDEPAPTGPPPAPRREAARHADKPRAVEREPEPPRPAEPRRPVEAPRAVEPPRHVEAPRHVEPTRHIEAPPRHIEAPRHVEPPRRIEAPRHVEPPARHLEPPRYLEPRMTPPNLEHDELLNGLKLPANGNLSSQWQRALDHRPGDLDDYRVKVVREYLQREFPTSVIYDFFAHDRGVQMFHLQDNLGAVVHTATVSGELLADFTESQIRAFLDKHKLARVLRQAGQAGVVVTRVGLKIERT